MLLALLVACPSAPTPAADPTGSANDCAALTRYARDADGDGYGDPDAVVLTCDPPPGYVADESDCKDTDPMSYAGAPDVCATLGVDEDCEGGDDLPTEAAASATTVAFASERDSAWWAVQALPDGAVVVGDPRWLDGVGTWGRVDRYGPDFTVEATFEGRSEGREFGSAVVVADLLPDGGAALVVGDPDGWGVVSVFDGDARGTKTITDAVYTLSGDDTLEEMG